MGSVYCIPKQYYGNIASQLTVFSKCHCASGAQNRGIMFFFAAAEEALAVGY